MGRRRLRHFRNFEASHCDPPELAGEHDGSESRVVQLNIAHEVFEQSRRHHYVSWPKYRGGAHRRHPRVDRGTQKGRSARRSPQRAIPLVVLVESTKVPTFRAVWDVPPTYTKRGVVPLMYELYGLRCSCS